MLCGEPHGSLMPSLMTVALEKLYNIQVDIQITKPCLLPPLHGRISLDHLGTAIAGAVL